MNSMFGPGMTGLMLVCFAVAAMSITSQPVERGGTAGTFPFPDLISCQLSWVNVDNPTGHLGPPRAGS